MTSDDLCLTVILIVATVLVTAIAVLAWPAVRAGRSRTRRP